MKNLSILLDSIALDWGCGVAGRVQCFTRSNPSNLRLLCLDHTIFLLLLSLFLIASLLPPCVNGHYIYLLPQEYISQKHYMAFTNTEDPTFVMLLYL